MNIPLLLAAISAMSAPAPSYNDYCVSTLGTTIVISAAEGGKSYIRYFGHKLEDGDIESLKACGITYWAESYPAFGMWTMGEKAMAVTHEDGDMTLDLRVQSVDEYEDSEGKGIVIRMQDTKYPFAVRQYFKAYGGADVISTWVEAENIKERQVTLHKFASAYLTFPRSDNYLVHFHGSWGSEEMMEVERLTNGQKVISNKDGLVNTETDNPSIMLSLDGKPQEEYGRILGVSLAWSGNYLIKAEATNQRMKIIAGINEDSSHWTLKKGETFKTPELAMSFSDSGMGGVSRSFHRWARKYRLSGGSVPHDILLNSWEGVFLNVEQKTIERMISDFSEMGGELFVLDDGWFGDKYPRDNVSSSLGDWVVCKKKLPDGLEALGKATSMQGMKFGLWIEPEMVNTFSEVYEKHPEWVLHSEGRKLSTGRGDTQVVLDLTNPEVQDYVYGVVDRLLTDYPFISYLKWDCNCSLLDYGSTYLPSDRQSHLYIQYHRSLISVLERIRAKYPDVVMQACASGGARVNYGILPYFNEFWTSDDTDAFQRVFIQWGTSMFYPAVAMGSHVSAGKNHQTGRTLPLKFRFDVAMSGRLGMEMQPSELSAEEMEFAIRAIDSYKKIRSTVQQGDLYRLISPYDGKGIASLMYVNPDKDESVLFAYKMQHMINQTLPVIKLSGLDPGKRYVISELCPQKESAPVFETITVSGRVLIEDGLNLEDLMQAEYSSASLLLKAVD